MKPRATECCAHYDSSAAKMKSVNDLILGEGSTVQELSAEPITREHTDGCKVKRGCCSSQKQHAGKSTKCAAGDRICPRTQTRPAHVLN